MEIHFSSRSAEISIRTLTPDSYSNSVYSFRQNQIKSIEGGYVLSWSCVLFGFSPKIKMHAKIDLRVIYSPYLKSLKKTLRGPSGRAKKRSQTFGPRLEIFSHKEIHAKFERNLMKSVLNLHVPKTQGAALRAAHREIFNSNGIHANFWRF